MDFERLGEKYLPLAKRYWLPLTFSGVGLLFMLVGMVSMVLSENKSQGVIFEEAASTERQESIVVDVSGAVLKPGVYKLVSDARIQEALIAAGGLAQNADREYISKNINLALKISDGSKIYIPAKGESITHSASSGQAGSVAGTNSGVININTASLSQLDSLPGVGLVIGQKIIDNRPYSSIEDLVSKKVVGTKVFEKIKEKITTY